MKHNPWRQRLMLLGAFLIFFGFITLPIGLLGLALGVYCLWYGLQMRPEQQPGPIRQPGQDRPSGSDRRQSRRCRKTGSRNTGPGSGSWNLWNSRQTDGLRA